MKNKFILSLVLGVVILSVLSSGFVYAGWFNKATGKAVDSNGEKVIVNPKDDAGNYILVSKHYYGENYTNYAGAYCQKVQNCTGFKDVTVLDDAVKACRCDSFWGCPYGTAKGPSCVSDVSSDSYWERVGSVTCTGCDVPDKVCEDTCSSLGYECGTQSVCSSSVNCGTCDSEEICQSGSCISGNTSTAVSGCDYLRSVNDNFKSTINQLEGEEKTIILKEGKPIYLNNYVVVPSNVLGLSRILKLVAIYNNSAATGGDKAIFLDMTSGANYSTYFISEGYGTLDIYDVVNRTISGPRDTVRLFAKEGESYVTLDYESTTGDNKLSYEECDFNDAIVGSSPRCIDGDNGLDYNVKSVNTQIYTYEDNWVVGEKVSYSDSCTSGTDLKEFYCNDYGILVEGKHNCSNGCSNGACISGTNQTCEDTCSSLGYECGAQSVCGSNVNCGTCGTGYNCSLGVCVAGGASTSGNNQSECSLGCTLDGKCYPFGYRKNGQYCTDSYNFQDQLSEKANCENNFECGSNLCVNNECVSGSLIQKMFDWFRKLFGGQ